jgi:hypothetical protein
MKKILFVMMLALTVLGFNQANSYAYTTSYNVTSLDHSMAYAWRITDFALPTGNAITSASVTYYNIYDWRVETI